MPNRYKTDDTKDVTNPIINREEQMVADKIQLVFKYSPVAIMLNPVVALLVIFLDWDYIAHSTLWGWFTFLTLAAFIRGVVWFEFRRRKPPVQESRKWGKLLAFSMAGSGLAWGSTAVFLFPTGEIIPQLAIMTIIAGITAGAMASSVTYLPVFYSFLFPSQVPISVVMFMQGTSLHNVFGVVEIIFIIIMVWFSRANYQGFAELIDLRIELNIQKNRAEQANIAKSKFLAAASHDIRQPLHALSLLLGTLDIHLHDNKQSRMLLERINGSVKDLEKLFDSLLDLSKLDAQVVKPRMEVFPVKVVLDKLESDWKKITQANDLEWRLEGNAGTVLVHSDRILLLRILGNLLSNAIKYTQKGKISLGVQTKDEGVEIYVKDTGQGIPLNKQQEIFHEFFQLGNSERNREQGLGLGLSIVQRLTDLIESSVIIDSEPGKGSCFSLLLPYGDTSKIKTTTDNSIQQILQGFNNTRVLVIDDEENIRIGMESILEKWGCQVIAAASCKQAISILDEQQQVPELILADYRLANNKNGIDAISHIRQHVGKQIPALIITGDVASEQLREIDASGFILLHKPLALARLRIAMRQILQT